MKDHKGTSTADILGEKCKPGPKPSGKALTRAEIQRNYRQRQRDKLAYLESLLEHNHGLLAAYPFKVDRHDD